MMTDRRRVAAAGYATVAAAFLALAVVMVLPLSEDSPADGSGPANAIALIGLACTVVSTHLALRAWRWQKTTVADLVLRLVDEVRATETVARAQLLGRHDKPIDVHFDFHPAPAHNAQQTDVQNVLGHTDAYGRLREVVDYYQRLHPRRMVITGEPGSGKTLMAIEMILGLIETRSPDHPVPVRLSAATWSTDTDESVQEWLVRHLVTTFKLPVASARALLIGQKILPVIDGLDEMDADPLPGYASRTARAIEALNYYQHSRAKAELIVTCRTGHYLALRDAQIWAQDAAHIQLRAVDPVQARAFLTERVLDLQRWRPVLDILDHDPHHALAAALSTPWRLTLAAVVYEQRHPRTGAFLHDPAQLADPALATPDRIRDHLLAQFIPATIGITSSDHRPDQVHRWLAVLATYLDANTRSLRRLGGRTLSGTDLVLHELWPLAGAHRPRLTVLAFLAGPWLLAAPVTSAYLLTMFRSTRIAEAAAVVLVMMACVVGTWATVWPEPERPDFSQLRTAAGRRQLAYGSALGSALGFAFGFSVGRAEGGTVGLLVGLIFGSVSA